MARGWESKAVADQIDAGKERPPELSASGKSREKRERQARLESLRLSRSRVLQQLERAHAAAYREVLLKGLKAIEQNIEDLSSETLAIPADGIPKVIL